MSQALSSYFQIEATPRPGHTVEELQKVIDEEIAKLQREAPTEHEVQRAINQIEASFYNRMERVGGFGGKADQLNAYFSETGIPTGSTKTSAAIARCRRPTSAPRRSRFLPADRRVELTVMPDEAVGTVA